MEETERWEIQYEIYIYIYIHEYMYTYKYQSANKDLTLFYG